MNWDPFVNLCLGFIGWNGLLSLYQLNLDYYIIHRGGIFLWPFKKSVQPTLNIIEPIKKTNYTKDTDKIVEGLFEGQYFLIKSLEVLDFKKGIDWNYQHHSGANTYQLYLHSLETIHHLCNHYEKKKDKKSLKKAYEILQDWAKHDEAHPKENYRSRWSDHATATRALAIIYLYTSAVDIIKIDEELIYNLLLKHARFLNDDQNYRKNNHGIMVDRALLSIALVLSEYPEAEHWKEKAIYRVREAFNRDFSYKNVHLENSPDYHSMVMRLIQSVESFLVKNNLTLGKDIVERLEQADDYFHYFLKPNLKVPTIGDTSSGHLKRKKKKFDSFIDEEAGIAILQDEHEEPERSTWLSFICGYGSKTHKHFDDLSFNLFYNGKDIFVDSGKYNYVKSDKIRQYVLSPIAHNTLAIDGKEYKLGDPLVYRDKIKITGYHKTLHYELIQGENKAYNGAKLKRTLIFFKPDVIIIFDQAVSDEDQKFLQLYNLAPHIEILETKDNYAKIKSGADIIEIEQLLGTSSVTSFQADRTEPRAIMSERFNELIDISQLEFSKTGENVNYLTMISFGNEQSIQGVTFDETSKILTLNRDGKKLDIAL